LRIDRHDEFLDERSFEHPSRRLAAQGSLRADGRGNLGPGAGRGYSRSPAGIRHGDPQKRDPVPATLDQMAEPVRLIAVVLRSTASGEP
jgi:hypothetical protein